MSENEEYSEDYLEFLTNKIVNTGKTNTEAQEKAKLYNFWERLGFCFGDLYTDFQEYCRHKKAGDKSGIEFPQLMPLFWRIISFF